MLRVAITALAMCATVGCGGLNGSYNISPATFLLPGIGAVTPPSTNAPTEVDTIALLQ